MGKKALALGRGLAAILKDHDFNAAPVENENVNTNIQDDKSRIVEISLDLVDPNPYQPRKHFSEEELSDLAETIKIHGLIQPIAVRKVEGRYQIISGERRTRASRLAGMTTIKAQVFENLSEKVMNEWALIENIQRVDLNAIEIAESYQQLIDNHGYTHEDLAKNVGKSRSSISNALRLLKLPEQVKNWVREGKLSSGAARTLCGDGVKDPEAIAKIIIEKGLSVRDAEALLRGDVTQETKPEDSEEKPEAEQKSQKEKPELSADMKRFESAMETYFGTKVSLNPSGSDQSKGTIVINYYSMDDLTRIQELMER
ncbi:MAG: ParB/RepB/Spo0J family partition protein [Fibrobacteraceae bacterium]|nr:ParB/RepB/Spo0J family partition protein [Fibrobacteraceae bacterium]